MLFIRSLFFNIAFYVNLTFIMVFGLPTLFFGRAGIQWLARIWGRSSLWLLDVICDVKAEFRGEENLIQSGCIIAAKHQSAWETFALLTQVKDFSYILKIELTWTPLFGMYLTRSHQIAVNRQSRGAALRDLLKQASTAIREGRAIFIFPEGTRRPAGAQPAYKSGVAHIYTATGAPCVPVALNSGLCWPRRTLLRRPGTIIVEYLPVIEPGLPGSQFMKILQERIETATDRLIAESLAKYPDLALNLATDEAQTVAAD